MRLGLVGRLVRTPNLGLAAAHRQRRRYSCMDRSWMREVAIQSLSVCHTDLQDEMFDCRYLPSSIGKLLRVYHFDKVGHSTRSTLLFKTAADRCFIRLLILKLFIILKSLVCHLVS